MGWLIALGVLAVLVYAAWEFRWYLAELSQNWTQASDRDQARPSPELEPTGRRRST